MKCHSFFYTAFLSSTAAVLSLFATITSAAQPIPFKATYETSYGVMSARGERKLERDRDNLWKMENNAHVLMMDVVERSSFIWHNNLVVSQTYDYTNPLNQDRSLSLSFDWAKNSVINNGSKQMLELAPGVYDKLSYQLQMQMNVCANPDSYVGENFTVVDRKKLKTYRVELVGRDTQKTPVGVLNTIHLKQFRPERGDADATHIWLAADWSCLLVRLDQHDGGDVLSLKLVKASVNGADVKEKAK
ncbi:MAG: DUF3108 domain-containing protein [Spongiibacteraceae bacterium]